MSKMLPRDYSMYNVSETSNVRETSMGGFNETIKATKQEPMTASSLRSVVQKPICYAALEQLINISQENERREKEYLKAFTKKLEW